METSNPAGLCALTKQWILVAVAIVLASTLVTIDFFTFPRESLRGERTPLTFVAGLIILFTQGAWISMDRRRRGREVGYWRFGAILLGPLVIGIYLILEYRLKALILIPAMAGSYLALGIIPAIAGVILRLTQR